MLLITSSRKHDSQRATTVCVTLINIYFGKEGVDSVHFMTGYSYFDTIAIQGNGYRQ